MEIRPEFRTPPPPLLNDSDVNFDGVIDDGDLFQIENSNYLLYGTLTTRYLALINTIDEQNKKCQQLLDDIKSGKQPESVKP